MGARNTKPPRNPTLGRATHVRRSARASMAVEQAWEEWQADRTKQQIKEKLATDPAFYLHRKMRSAISTFLRKRRLSKEDKSTLEVLGYPRELLARHIERQFAPEMGWHNRNRWHIDHIVPLVEFKCQSVDDPEFKAAWALSNLRPIWVEENLRKAGKRVFLL